MKPYLLLLLLLASSLLSQAQRTIQLSGYLPKVQTAEAMAVQRYTTYPMDYSTGLPNITIPLYEIKSGDITLPITLTYHSSGFKPNEATGRIATGWTLNAEPSISKQVRGLDDATYPGTADGKCGFYYRSSYPYNDNLYKKKVADGKIDGLPDIYYYRLADKGGAFTTGSYNGSSQRFISQPYSDLKITGSPRDIMIEDDNGISYKFGGGSSYINSYYHSDTPVDLLCREITSKMTRSRIGFVYNQSGLLNFDYRSYVSNDAVIIEQSSALRYPRLTRIINGNQRMYDIQDSGNLQELYYTEYNYAPYVDAANITEAITTQPLREISFDNGSVFFEGDNRTGIRISVKDQSGVTIKEINLYCSSYSPYEDEATDMQHRKLDSIRIGVPGGDIQRYTFDYFSGDRVPDRDTRAVDYWGFYNGIYGSKSISMVPSFSTTLSINSRSVTFEHAGMNRTPNVYATMTGVLNKITDPNGAETSFEYEGNKTGINAAHYYADTTAQMPPGFWIETQGPFVPQLNYDIPIGGLRIKRITEKDPVTGKNLYREFSYGCLTEYWGENYNFPNWGVPKKLIGPITFQTRQEHVSEGYASQGTSNINTWYCNPIAEITFSGGTPILYGRVTERKWGGDSDNVWTEYYYTAPRLDTHRSATIGDECDGWDYPCIFNGKLVINDWRDIKMPFSFKTFYDERYGKLYKKIDYAQTAGRRVPVRKEEYKNTFIEGYLSLSMWSDYVYRTRTYINTDRPLSEQEIANREVFETPYLLRQDDGIITLNIVSSQKVTEYSPAGDSVVITKDYRYTNSPNDWESSTEAKVRNITTYLNGNRKQEELFTYSDGKYPLTHYPEPLYPTGDLSRHPGGILTEHKTIIGNDTTYTRQKLNAVDDDFFVINPIRTKSIPGSKFDQVLDMKYNNYGNVTQTVGLDGKPIAYIWSYNNQQLVAKIENATFQSVSDALGISPEGVTGIPDLRNRPDVSARLNSLRALLPDAHVYTYLYKPLVGMVSATDPSGKTTYYEYDSSNRLKRTYFKEGDVERTIQSQEYNLRK